MKNWNDAGSVHYDAQTNERYALVTLDFVAAGCVHKFALEISLRIRERLKSEHYFKAVDAGLREFLRVHDRLIAHGARDRPALFKACHHFAFIAMRERLYEEFTIEQARLGNQVWATPERLQEIGPRPENDEVM
jgi:hypothetical protein